MVRVISGGETESPQRTQRKERGPGGSLIITGAIRGSLDQDGRMRRAGCVPGREMNLKTLPEKKEG